MKQPTTVGKLVEIYQKIYPNTDKKTIDSVIESDTCSIMCKKCKSRVYFNGSFTDDDMPLNYTCPHCKKFVQGSLI